MSERAHDPAGSAILDAARRHEMDFYMAATLAPRAARADLIVLAAYFGDVARIPLDVSDATLGEIRLQWWRDTLASAAPSGHPVADAMTLTAAGRALDPADVALPLERAASLLYGEPFPTEDEFEAVLLHGDGAHMRLRGQILGVRNPDHLGVLERAGSALGLVRHLARLPFLFAKGRVPLPAPRLSKSNFDTGLNPETAEDIRHSVAAMVQDASARVRAVRRELLESPGNVRQAALPLALAGPYLKALQRVGRDPMRDLGDLLPIHRATALAWAAFSGRT